MKETIKKPLRQKEAFNVITADQEKPAALNLATRAHRCNSDNCTEASDLGRIAANHYLAYGGSELNMLASMTDDLCRSCRARFLASYFTKMEAL